MSKAINLIPLSDSGLEQVELPTITANFRNALNFLFECADFVEEISDKVCGELLPKLDKAIEMCEMDMQAVQLLIHGTFSTSEHLLQQLKETRIAFEQNQTHVVSIF